MRHVIGFILIFLAGMAVVVGIAGFRGQLSRKPPIEIFPDMNRQLKLRPQQPNGFFANGISSQLPPAGTIARNAPIRTVNGPVYPYEDAPVTPATSRARRILLKPIRYPSRQNCFSADRNALTFIARPVTARWVTATASRRNSV
jgi:hypothetical protein